MRRQINHRANGMLIILVLACSACGGGSSSKAISPQVNPAPLPNIEPVTFHCSKDSSCPEVVVSGDPFDSLNGAPAPFRGYADPSLEYDPVTDTIWMAYSWLNVQISDPTPPVEFDLGVRTHLARSDDGGNTFSFVRSINEMEMELHPDTSVAGWSTHEVSTLLMEPTGNWQVLWLKYFNPFGTVAGVDERQEFLYSRSFANIPEQLGDSSAVWSTGSATSSSWGAPFNFASITELSDCDIQTEPALFALDADIFLVTSCIVVDSNGRRADLERLVLLRQTSDGYSFVGNIMDGQDALDLGVDVIQQADVSVARDGSILLIVTPIVLDADPSHQGCIVYEFDSFLSASLKRDDNGKALARNIITADGNGLGPGLCTYDAKSESGIMLVITTVNASENDVEFSLHATGVHP